MKPSRPLFLVALVVVVAVISWAVLRSTYLSLPPLPWTAVPTLLLLALAEGFTGLNVLRRIRRKPGKARMPESGRRPAPKPLDPMAVARLAALGKASAHAAAVIAGVFGGFAGSLASSLDKQTPRHDFFVSGGTFLAAVVLVAAAFFLEYACRVPKDPDEEDRDHRASRA
jgi:protein-S-isoprenylcysteine O-methyltransferase Ste14